MKKTKKYFASKSDATKNLLLLIRPLFMLDVTIFRSSKLQYNKIGITQLAVGVGAVDFSLHIF